MLFSSKLLSRCLFAALKDTSKSIMIPRAASSVLQSVRKIASLVSHSRKVSYPGSKITVNGVDLHYEQVGNGEHPVLLMPGALGSTRTDFSCQIDGGLDRNAFTLVAWDPPGYGYSRPPKKSFFKNYLLWDAELADGLMSRLGYSRYSIVGWSEGGTTGMHLAARNPQKVRSMVVWGTKTCWTPRDMRIINMLRDMDKWSSSIRAPMESLYGAEGFKKLVNDYCDLWERLGTTKSLKIEEAKEGESGDLCLGALPHVKAPLLVVHGQKDPMADSAHHSHIVNTVSGAKLFTFTEGKHNLHVRYAKEFNALVNGFLKSH